MATPATESKTALTLDDCGVVIEYTATSEGSISEIGTVSWNNNFTGKLYLATLPYGTEIQSLSFKEPGVLVNAIGSGEGTPAISDVITNQDYFEDAEFKDPNNSDLNDYIFAAIESGADAIPTTNVKGFYARNLNASPAFYDIVCVQISTADPSGGGGGDEPTVNRDALDEAIEEVWNGSTYTDNYYTSIDRWNGTNAYPKDTNNPERGFFWAATEGEQGNDTPLEVALEASTQDEVDDALALLSAAIAKLIPSDQANTTLLYEAIKACENLSNDGYYTQASWTNFETAREEAVTLMAKMFDENGNALPEDNKPESNEAINAAAAKLMQAYDDLFPATLNNKLSTLKMAETWLLSKGDLDSSKYESSTWNTWVEKRNALNEVRGMSVTLMSDYETWTGAIVEAAAAYAGLKDANDSITVHVRVADNYGAAYPTYALASAALATYDADVTLSGSNRTLGGALSAISYSPAQISGGSGKYGPQLMAYINGELAVSITDADADSWSTYDSAVRTRELHDGDSIVLARVETPMVFRYSEDDRYFAPYRAYYPYVGFLDIQGNSVVEVYAGAELELTVERYSGALGTTVHSIPAKNVDLLLSEAKDSQEAAAVTRVTVKSGALTDANGKASTVLYEEGWYRLEAVVTAEQTNAVGPDFETITGGDYSNLFAGDYVLIHVKPNPNEAAVREEFLAELREVYELYPESYFNAEQWEAITSAYTEGCSNITNAATLQESKEALDAAKETITALQEEATWANNDALENFRYQLSRLPDDASKLTQGDIAAMQELIASYEALSAYAKDQLTSAEDAKYNALLQAYGTDGSTLPEEKAYALSATRVVENQADRAVFDALFAKMEEVGVIEGSQPFSYLGESGTVRSFEATPGTFVEFIAAYSWLQLEPDALAALSDAVDGFTYDAAHNNKYYVNGKEYKIEGITINGEAATQVNSYGSTHFYMPYEDVTVVVTYGPVETVPEEEQQLIAAKEAALAELEETYNSYSRSDYTDENWAALREAYQDGIAAINSATTIEDVQSALSAAKAAMSPDAIPPKPAQTPETIEGWGVDDAFDAGAQVGTVNVTVVNNTFDEGAFRGNIIEPKTNYPIGENDNMMTVILRALHEEGFSWEGTGGSASDAYDISYLAKIKKEVDGQKLEMGEFSGDPGSGWMGALNDFMVNEGLNMFTVASGKLGDGDEVALMFTQNRGEDLGGTWGNSNTTLKSLDIENGELIPSFESGESGNTYDYALKISGSSASVLVTPHATNINFMVKTFLNEKVTTDAVGNSYYRRTEYITVRPGDVIYVGCGERAWPSMNNQGAEASGYSGTWYALHVISANDGADYVNELIAKLPAENKISLSNYKDVQEQIAEIDEIIAALSSSEQSNVNDEALEAARDRTDFFAEIAEVKAMLAALPKSSNLDDAGVLAARRDIEAADAAYKALIDEQKGYITVGDVANYNELVERLKALTPDTPATPIVGSDPKPEMPFVDVAEDAFYYDAVLWAVNSDPQITNGTSETTFEPNADCLREQIVTFLWRAAGKPAPSITESPFEDVAEGAYYYDAVLWAYENGITLGVDATHFGVGQPCTREQVVTFLWRAANKPATSVDESFTDVADGEYYAEAVNWAAEEEITLGIGDGKFGTGLTCTRGQIVTFLYRAREE